MARKQADIDPHKHERPKHVEPPKATVEVKAEPKPEPKPAPPKEPEPAKASAGLTHEPSGEVCKVQHDDGFGPCQRCLHCKAKIRPQNMGELCPARTI